MFTYFVWLRTESGDRYSYTVETDNNQEVVDYVKEQLGEELAWVYEFEVSTTQGNTDNAVLIEFSIRDEIKKLKHLLEY